VRSLQGVQHHLADMLILSDSAYAAVLQALWTSTNRTVAGRATSTAKLWAARAYRTSTILTHQLQGGAGYVREADLYHLYSERAAADSLSLGTRDDHLRRRCHVL
jgi:3-oxocholest-4-en-26-oyl-CoA dehydrogenase beta subunit